MRRVILLAAFLSMFMHVGVAYASGPVGSVPPPQYPNWGCTGTCNSSNGDWSLTAGSSMVTNVASLYANENVVIDVNDLVVPSNACIDITVDTLHICTSANGLYPWTFSNVSGSYHQIQIFCSTSCQGNYLVSVLPISAPSPTPTPNPSFTATPTPPVQPTVTPPVVPRITHTPTVSPTPCVVDSWGCDQPATATYVACESGLVVNNGADPCVPTVTPTSAATATPTNTPPAGTTIRDCGVNMVFHDCSMAVSTNGAGYWPIISGFSAGCGNQQVQIGSSPNNLRCAFNGGPAEGSWQLFTSPGDGYVTADLTCNGGSGYNFGFYTSAGAVMPDGPTYHSSVAAPGGTCHEDFTQTYVAGGISYYFYVEMGGQWGGVLNSITFTGTPSTATPTPSPTAIVTGTPGPTWTPRPTFTRTPVVSPTNTPIGYVAPTATILANIDTCLGTVQDCNLALTPIAGKIGGIPGLIATPMAPLNTSVFSPFQTIGITRGGCLSFGKLPVVVPHIIWLASPVPVMGGPAATPNISGYVPISVTWTLPTVVGTPMRQGNFGPIDPIEFEPCNDPAFPTWGWDLSWNASTFFEWVGFFVWTIALIRRIFG